MYKTKSALSSSAIKQCIQQGTNTGTINNQGNGANALFEKLVGM